MWYDMPPKEYAKSCRYSAERSDASATRIRAEIQATWRDKPPLRGEDEAKYFDRQARRCRAMALLCENSDAKRAGDVDFKGLDRPEQNLDIQLKVIKAIERKYQKGQAS